MSAFVQLGVLDGQPITEPPTHRTHVRAHLRRVKGEAPPSGAQFRDAAMAAHDAKETVRVAKDYLRQRLREVYAARALVDPEGAYVTADDVDDLLREWSACPAVLRSGPQNWRGTVFAGKGWALTGQTVPSTRRAMRAHRNPCWRPVDRDAVSSAPSHRSQRRTA